MKSDKYPAWMTECVVVGLNGDCGPDCPQFKRGECQHSLVEPVEKKCEEGED